MVLTNVPLGLTHRDEVLCTLAAVLTWGHILLMQSLHIYLVALLWPWGLRAELVEWC